VRRRSEKYVAEGSRYAHWIGLYLRYHSNWLLGLCVHGRLYNLRTSKVTFALVVTPSKIIWCIEPFSLPTCLQYSDPAQNLNLERRSWKKKRNQMHSTVRRNRNSGQSSQKHEASDIFMTFIVKGQSQNECCMSQGWHGGLWSAQGGTVVILLPRATR